MNATQQMIAKHEHRFPLIIGLTHSYAIDLAHPSHVARDKHDSACMYCRAFGPVRVRSSR